MREKGFTLIELLIVIAIIGLLASVVLASLSMARTKALNAKGDTIVIQYKKVFDEYEIDHGYYPTPTTANTEYCLGSYPSGTCAWASMFTSGTFNVDAQLSNELRPYYPKLPAGPSVAMFNGPMDGPLYKCTNASGGKCRQYLFEWYLSGSESCNLGASTLHIFGYTSCVYTSPVL